MANNVKKSNRLFIAFAFVFSLLALPASQTVVEASGSNAATVSVERTNGEAIVSTSAVNFEEGDTAFDLLMQVTNGEVEYDESEHGKFITGIADETPANSEEFWTFAVNGGMTEVGADSYRVDHGDNIRFMLGEWPATMTATVEIKDAEGQAILFETGVEVVAGSNAYDALYQAASQAGLALDLSMHPEYFVGVNNIAGANLGETEYWQFNVSGEAAPVGVSSYRLSGGESISFEIDDWAAGSEDNGDEDSADTDQNGGESDLPPAEDQGESQVDDGEQSESETSAEEATDEADDDDQQRQNEAVNISNALASVKNYVGPTEEMTYGDEWQVWPLSHDSSNDFSNYIQSVVDVIDENDGQLRSLELHKLVISLSLLNQDPTDVAGHNLVDNMLAMENTLNNAIIYALIALNSAPEGSADQAVVQEYVDLVVDRQLANGGWNLFGDADMSVDITAMALTALAPHRDQAAVAETIDQGFARLSEFQGEDGMFYEEFSGGNSSEAISQVIVALTANNIDPLNDAFVKSGNNLIDNLLAFQQADGGFAHLLSEGASNGIATEQALLALVAYDLYLNDLGSVYLPTQAQQEPSPTPGPEKPDETEDKDPDTDLDEGKGGQTTDPNDDGGQATDPDETDPNAGSQPGGQKPGEAGTGSGQGESDEDLEEEGQDQVDDSVEEESFFSGRRLPDTSTLAGNFALVGIALTGAGLAIKFKKKQ